tara:strand:+ start:441 stop:764 length:324 start_codon:yes stop_codon:yes gene_type:complete
MKKIIKHLLSIILLSVLLTGCKTLKEGLEGSKKSKSAEEFLIEKKNPLELPPDFEVLPVPQNENLENTEEKKFDINKIIGESSLKKKKNLNKDNSLEKSIIEKIKSD